MTLAEQKKYMPSWLLPREAGCCGTCERTQPHVPGPGLPVFRQLPRRQGCGATGKRGARGVKGHSSLNQSGVPLHHRATAKHRVLVKWTQKGAGYEETGELLPPAEGGTPSILLLGGGGHDSLDLGSPVLPVHPVEVLGRRDDGALFL